MSSTTRVRPRSGGFHRGGAPLTSRVNSPRYPVPRATPRTAAESGEPCKDKSSAVFDAPRVEYVPPSERKEIRKEKQPLDEGASRVQERVRPSSASARTYKSGFEAMYDKEFAGDGEEDPINVGNCVNDFNIVEELGKGAFGSVSRVVSKKDGKTYALKKIEVAHLKQRNQREALSEVSILKRVKHPNIIRYYNSFMENSVLYIVMEYAAGGDLQKMVQRQRKLKKYVRESLLWKFMWEMSQALKYLHEEKIIHRDMKSLNVFLSGDQKIKIGDLGVSRLIGDDEMMAQTRVGTPLYLAPELIKRQPYDYKVDIWSLGCLMYQLCALRPPFEGDNIYALAVEIMNQTPRALPSHYSADLCSVIFRMLEKKAKDRPYVNSVINSLPSTLAARFRNGDHSDNQSANPDPVSECDVSVAEKKQVLRPASASRVGTARRQDRLSNPTPSRQVYSGAAPSSGPAQRPASARMRRHTDGNDPSKNNIPFSVQQADASQPLQISVKQYTPSDHFSQTGQNRASSMPEPSHHAAATERVSGRVSSTAYNDARPIVARRSVI